jgi:1-deoxy-D-xylulose-5-phosphate reductoisomerase
MIKVAILGSTGSIGTQALNVIKDHNSDFELVGITAHANKELLKKQILEYKPKYAALRDELEVKGCHVFYRENYLEEFLKTINADIVLNAIGGIYGLEASISLIEKGIDIALANKESIVSFGSLLMELARKNNVNIYPVDSEHSALWQAMNGEDKSTIEKLIITASGGPFRGRTRDELKGITPKEALSHPTWSMGQKISIDSATLMNKGLEVIEASVLFNIPFEKIEVVVHPQSIVHSIVEFSDGAQIAQLGSTSMYQPIQYALYRGTRVKNNIKRLDLASVNRLDFFKPDLKTFKCLSLAYKYGKLGGILPAVLNAANNVAVEAFIDKKIEFLEIPDIIEDVLKEFKYRKIQSIEDVLETQKKAVDIARAIIT